MLTAAERAEIARLVAAEAPVVSLCPSCALRVPAADSGLCEPCDPSAAARVERRRELARARHRRWWAKNGRAWRASRQAVAA